jgi:hypothetical protein
VKQQQSTELYFRYMQTRGESVPGSTCDDYLSFGNAVCGQYNNAHLPILDSGLCRHEQERRILRALDS